MNKHQLEQYLEGLAVEREGAKAAKQRETMRQIDEQIEWAKGELAELGEDADPSAVVIPMSDEEIAAEAALKAEAEAAALAASGTPS